MTKFFKTGLLALTIISSVQAASWSEKVVNFATDKSTIVTVAMSAGLIYVSKQWPKETKIAISAMVLVGAMSDLSKKPDEPEKKN